MSTHNLSMSAASHLYYDSEDGRWGSQTDASDDNHGNNIQLLLHSTHTHTHTRLTALCPGLPGWASTRKKKTIGILLKQETVSGSGIRWAICKSAPRSSQITMPAPHHSYFTGRMPFLPPNQQRQSTEGIFCCILNSTKHVYYQTVR